MKKLLVEIAKIAGKAALRAVVDHIHPKAPKPRVGKVVKLKAVKSEDAA